jgi:hypothetical protein
MAIAAAATDDAQRLELVLVNCRHVAMLVAAVPLSTAPQLSCVRG